jgi:hypothetical protein
VGEYLSSQRIYHRQNILASVKLTLTGLSPFFKKKKQGRNRNCINGKKEQIKFGKYLLLFGSEYFVFSSAI